MRPPPCDTIVVTAHIRPHVVPASLPTDGAVMVSPAENARLNRHELCPVLTEDEGAVLSLLLSETLLRMPQHDYVREQLQSAAIKLATERQVLRTIRQREARGLRPFGG